MFVLFLTLFFTVNGDDNCTSDSNWMSRGVLFREALSDKCDRIVLSEIVEVRLVFVYDILKRFVSVEFAVMKHWWIVSMVVLYSISAVGTIAWK